MTRIDFAFGAPDRLQMACDVARKHYLSGRSLIVYSGDADILARFDHLLWSFDATAFVPHVTAGDPLAAHTPVWLTANAPQPPANAAQTAWLLNLDQQCPPGIEHFERALEIVSDQPEDKQAARQRWRQYQADGHTLHAHDVSGRQMP